MHYSISYNAIGGKTKKLHYYTFFDHRNGDGWRENSRYFTNAGFGTVTYYFTPKFSLTAEVMHSHIRSQQAGRFNRCPGRTGCTTKFPQP